MTLTKINSQGIKDNEISNADISNSAAIAGNKISPDFGSQNIITTGKFITNSSSANDYIRLYAGNGTGKWDIYGNGANLRISDNDSAGAVTFDTNVGIGTTSPSGKFDVTDGTTSISFNKTSNTPRIDFKGNNVSDLCQIKAAESSGGGVLQFFTKTTGGTATERVRVDTSGNVGIGTTSPSQKLEVSGNTKLSGTGTNALEINGTGVHELYSYHDSGGVGWATGTGGSYGELLYLDESNSAIEIFTGGSRRLTVNSSGNVGIGTASPAKLLDVKLESNGTVGQYLRNTVINLLSKINGTTSAQFGTETSHPLTFLTGNTERMRIDQSGRVMIGVTGVNHASANADDFCVGNNDSSSEHGITIGSNVAGTIRGADSGSGGAGIIEYVHSADQMKFYTAGTLAATIKSNQRVLMPAVYSAAGSSMRDVQIESDGNLCGLSSITAAKTNITDLTDVSWIYNLKPKSFNFRKKTVDPVTGVNTYLDEAEDEKAHGFLAEDVESINKDFCFYDKDSEGKDVLAGVYYKTMVVPLIKAVQDLKAENTSLAKRVAALEAA